MLGKYFTAVRNNTPLVHNITNYVTVNDVANVILACGASPIMSDEPEDVKDITSICGGLNINIGTLCRRSIESIMTAFLVAVQGNEREKKLEAAAAAVASMGLAGEIGWNRMQEGDGNSTYRNRIIDAIYNMDAEILDKGANYEVR